jgi:hypothetical protein
MTNGEQQVQQANPIPVATLTLSPIFKKIFNSVLVLTILSLVVSLALVIFPTQTDDVKRLIETCSTTFKMGFGAVVGLIGGKALQ